MPTLIVDKTLAMYYERDSFVEPWREPETVLLVHGIGGCTAEWYAWIPPLSARYDVVRVDLRGWGRSTVPDPGYAWSMDAYAEDLVRFLDGAGLGTIHFVGAKLGGRIGIHFALAYPERLSSLALVSTPMTIRHGPQDDGARLPKAEDGSAGAARWARETMHERLGDVPPEMLRWWIDVYSRSAPHVLSEVYRLAWSTDEHDLLARLTTPTLVLDSPAMASVETIRAWQRQIPGSELAIIPTTTEGRQISVSKAAECIAALVDFWDRLRAETVAA
jgi:3-oxoadipate enol-lactonase